MVLRARFIGWSRELATTSLVTGIVLIPFGRLHILRCSRADGLRHTIAVAYRTSEATMTLVQGLIPKLYAPVSDSLVAATDDAALHILHPNAAGIDIGESEHRVAVPAHRDPQAVRCFGTFSVDLQALADWLIACGVTTVAMESEADGGTPPRPGAAWRPLTARRFATALHAATAALTGPAAGAVTDDFAATAAPAAAAAGWGERTPPGSVSPEAAWSGVA